MLDNFFQEDRLIGAFCALICTAAPALGEAVSPRFDDVTSAAGVLHTYGGSTDFVVGGGAAAFDCNGDLMPDLAIAGGDTAASLHINETRPGGAIRFRRVPFGAPILRATGFYPLDFDSDGVLDLFVLRFGRNLMLRGLGACGFEDATDALGLPGRSDWTTAFAATWEAGQDLPTLAIGNYVPRDRPLQQTGNCEPSYLLRPKGDRYGSPIGLGPGACTLSALFVDWSGTGRRDLRLANDREYYDRELSDQLWRLTPDGLFQYGEADGWAEPKLWGMGIAAQDLDQDGRPEISVTSMADNRLERLSIAATGPDFNDIAADLGATAHRPYAGGDTRPSTAWHSEFADFNNDGYADLLIMKGNVDAMPKMANFDPDNLLLGTNSGFEEAGDRAGIAIDTRGRGAAVADFNADGALDLVTVNRDQPVRVFQQKPLAARFVSIDPLMTGRNAFAVGATVSVKTADGIHRITRRVGGGHAGGSLVPLHFGLGTAETAEMRVIWPDGDRSTWLPVRAGDRTVISRVMQ